MYLELWSYPFSFFLSYSLFRMLNSNSIWNPEGRKS